MTKLSVVVPVYGCAGSLRELRDRLDRAIAPLTSSYELIFVEDRSPDSSWEVLRAIAHEFDHVRLIRLSRNFGQHAAITAGLAESSGDRIVVMDCDLQDPPEAIPRLWQEAEKGNDVVLARRKRRRQSFLRRISGGFYHGLRNVLVKGEMYTNYTNLSLISRKVVDAFLTLRDKDRQYLLIVHWLGFSQSEIEVDQAERPDGKSSYSLRTLAKVAVDGMFFQSTVLLRWIVYGGFLLAALGALLAAYTMITYAAGEPLPDWTLLPVFILILAGFIIISTGVTGLYVGKIFDQVKGRPLYVIETKVVAGAEHSVPQRLDDPTARNGDARTLEAAEPSAETKAP